MSTAERAPILLTPGPLTTSYRTRRAMMVDWGSWDSDFNELTASVCQRLLKIVGGEGSHTCVPLQGSGTFGVESVLSSVVGDEDKVLICSNGAYGVRMTRICDRNGAYGKRLAKICEVLQRPFSTFETEENVPTTAADVERLLAADPAISHVALIHCETSTGILNPLEAIAKVVERHGKRLIVDAMSSFGAIGIDARKVPFDALIAASGKCLEGVPGMGFVFARSAALEASAGNCHSLAMDLQDQHAYMRKTGQWRFTPPTHVVAALHEALSQYEEEGGLPARQRRYASNCETLLGEMARLGFRSFLPAEIQAPIIVTFHAPRDPRYRFADFYQRVREKGFILYPGKLTQVETFRVGCIGHVDAAEMRQAVAAIGEALRELEVLEI